VFPLNVSLVSTWQLGMQWEQIKVFSQPSGVVRMCFIQYVRKQGKLMWSVCLLGHMGWLGLVLKIAGK